MTLVCRPPATKSDMDDIINAFHKIINNKYEFEKRNQGVSMRYNIYQISGASIL